MERKAIAYVTSSSFKAEEVELVLDCLSSGGRPFRDSVSVEIRQVPILETLEVDLAVLVQAEVTKAYSQIRVPCIVEHAGLVFQDYLAEGYPGGLTKPMWNALREKFVAETGSAGRRALARAVVAFCDGMSVKTFVGETQGHIANAPRGSREFYWDTVFVPDEIDGRPGTLTYAEIVDDPNMGLRHKVTRLSQSMKALVLFFEHYIAAARPTLWR